jgi:DNA-binding CsgD family transcriptional regulator
MDHVELLCQAAIAISAEHEGGRAETLLRAALTELDVEQSPERAAVLYERVAREQFNQGRSREAAETRKRALALLPEEPSQARAQVLAGTMRELMLESRYHEAVETAGEALEIARAVGDEVSEVRILNGMGSSLFGLGRTADGEHALREALAKAKDGGWLDTALTVNLNLADMLASAGRLPEARVVAEEGYEFSRRQGRRRRWDDLLRAELAFDAGDWAASEAALPGPARPAMGTTFLNDALRRIELAMGRGDHERARQLLDSADDVGADTREPQWIGPLGALRAELERRGGDLQAARAAIDNALDRLDFCSDDVARMARVAAAGVRVEADAAVRARDLGEDPARAIGNAEMLLARVQACAEIEDDEDDEDTPPAQRPVEAAFLATAQAELARARDADDPGLWALATEAWANLGRPYRAAQTQRREAEALLASGDRDNAASTALAALESARQIGAAWLASEIEGFALRARLRLEQEPEAEPASSDGDEDPFGLTARERQVLALLAAGRTNREIGAELYMAEKTASVHVSRILSKLDVRSRTEAAALAHRVGLV